MKNRLCETSRNKISGFSVKKYPYIKLQIGTKDSRNSRNSHKKYRQDDKIVSLIKLKTYECLVSLSIIYLSILKGEKSRKISFFCKGEGSFVQKIEENIQERGEGIKNGGQAQI